MKIVYKYERKGFFGLMEYTEDSIICHSTKTANDAMKKAVKHMLANAETAIEFSEYNGNKALIVWQEYSDREKDVVTVRTFNPDVFLGWDETKISRRQMMKMLRELCDISEK